jgi:hypothetical protein
MSEQTPDANLPDHVPEAPDVLARDQNAATTSLATSNLATLHEGLSENSMAGSLQGLVDIDTKRINVGLILGIYAAWAAEDNRRFNLQRQQVTQAQANAAEVSKQLTEAKVENATLKAARLEQEKNRPLIGFAIFCGPILASIGIDQLKSNNYGTGSTLLLMGLALSIVAFWVINTKGGKA